MPRSPQDIYARHLLSPRGYPLWTPEPSHEFLAYRQDGLRIGDIGVVIPEDGCFDVFFNLCLPHDHPFHRATGVPDNFRPVELDDTDLRTVTNAENPGRIITTSSGSVKTVRTGDRSGGSPSTLSDTRSTGLEYDFSLSSSEGALLILPEGAERRDLRNHHRFLDAATRHGADWYRFAEEKVGQIIGNESLYLITGLYKTRSWSLAAFEETTGSAEYPAQLRLPQVGGGDLVTTCTWDTTRALDWRVGPVDNYGLPNQTVFIRGFKIAHRTGIFGARWITVKADAPSTRPNPVESIGAVPGDSWLAYMFGDLSTGRTIESSSGGARDEVAVDPTLDAARNEIQNNGALAVGEDVVIHRMPEVSQAFHPSDIINSYLLGKVPSANIAVTHDDEWITLLEKNLLRPEDLVQEGLLETLVSQNYDIFLEAGAVCLRSRYSDPAISSATEVQDSTTIMMPSPSGCPTAGQSSMPTSTFNQHHPSSRSHVPAAPRLRNLSLSEEPLPDLLRPTTRSPPTETMIGSGVYNPTEVQVDSQRAMPSGVLFKQRHEPTSSSYVPDTPKIRQRALSDEPHSDLRRPETRVDPHPIAKQPAKPLKPILKGPKNAETNVTYETVAETIKAIRAAIQRALRDSPPELINVQSGRLLNKSAQALSFESQPIFRELISSMITGIDHARIEAEVAQYYQYATFSHKWEDNEPLFDKVVNVAVYDLDALPTHKKLQMFCKIVHMAGFNWAWSDTCCINKDDHFVLQEALVSMFRWYHGSAMTVVFLLDVGRLSKWEDLTKSIWNTRAWTLQEYHASKVVRLYTQDWMPFMNLDIFNHKESPEIIAEMEKATGVSAQALIALRPGLRDIREKLRLASTRDTTRVEDAAYSLLGIFGMSMPVVYGEGDQALGRLLAQLFTNSGDTSILAWTGRSGSFNSCLPTSISVFKQLPTTHIPIGFTSTKADTVALTPLVDTPLITRFYDRLGKFHIPFFTGQRLKLPCLAFKLGRVKGYQRGSERGFRARTTALGIVEVRTTEDLSQLAPLYLVHPWINFLLGEEPVGTISQTGPRSGNTDSAESESVYSVQSEIRSSDEDEGYSPPPWPISPEDKETRVLRLAARLTRPFGGLLLTQTRRHVKEYRRVASESLITAQVMELTPEIMNVLSQSVRVLDVL